MLTSKWMLKDGLSRLTNINAGIKENTPADSLRSKLYAICYDMASAAEELRFMMDSYRYDRMKTRILAASIEIREATDALTIQNIVADVITLFDEDEDFHSATVSDFTTQHASAALSSPCISEQSLIALADAVRIPPRRINIFDPACNNGRRLETLQDHIPGSGTYGLEANDYLAEVARPKITKIAKGSLKGGRITNDVFDVLILEPAITWNFEIGFGLSAFKRTEKELFHDTLKYVRPGGVIMYIIPYFKLYKDLCLVLAKHLENVQVRTLTGGDFYKKGLIAIVGTRSAKKEVDAELYRMLRNLHTIEGTSCVIEKGFDPITLPEGYMEVEVFRGSVLDMDEMKIISNTSGCMDSFWAGQNVDKISDNVIKPLLPFNLGQIGLVLTSGCLDGIVEEGDGHAHAIKGRVTKAVTVERNHSGQGTVEVNETVANKVEIHAVLPNGEYKILA